ncbi:hypothetical protein [Oceanicaulis sp.]|uniref:hypothetical protein n=1 Tax=Oceanicaulis sp. TaxID=1924941 RepID=UPI003F708A56
MAVKTNEQFAEALAGAVAAFEAGGSEAELASDLVEAVTGWAQGGAGVARSAGMSAEVMESLNTYLEQAIDWYGGPADGGPGQDGLYPLRDAAGNEYLVPSPAALAAALKGLQVDAEGSFASRVDHDGAAPGFVFVSTDGVDGAGGPDVAYRKRGAGALWGDPIQIEGQQGLQGHAGWSAVYAIIADGERRVRQLSDWIGGAGDKPAGVGLYEGAAGLVADIADAVDIRGAQGLQGHAGWSPVHASVADGARVVRQLIDWTGGAGDKPAGVGLYEGAAGLVADIADATDYRGAQGLQGHAGWSAVYAIIADGERRVRQLSDWIGGAGDKPAGVGLYEGAAGLVADIADAVDIRGAQGFGGWSPLYGFESDGARRVAKLVDWIGGAGDKPAGVGLYVGAAGLVAAIADAVDMRGPEGAAALAEIADINGLQPALAGKLNTSGGVITGTLAGGENSVFRGFFMPQNPEGDHVASPFLFNDLAFARLRGATIVVEADGVDMGASDYAKDLMFNASADYWNVNVSADPELVITLTDLPKHFAFTGQMGIVFGSDWSRAKDVTLEWSADGGVTWVVARSVTDQGSQFVRAAFNNGATGVNALRITLANYESSNACRITSIFAYNYNSSGMEGLYVTRDGGPLYGDLNVNGYTVLHEGNFNPADYPYIVDLAPDSSYDTTPSGVYVTEMSNAVEPGWPDEYCAGIGFRHSSNRQAQLCVANDRIYFRRGHTSNAGGAGTGWSPWHEVWTNATLKPGALVNLAWSVTWTDDVVPPERTIRITATSTHTLPDDLNNWARAVVVEPGVTVTFDFGNNVLRDAEGNAVDLTNADNRTVAGPVAFSLLAVSGNVEIWL